MRVKVLSNVGPYKSLLPKIKGIFSLQVAYHLMVANRVGTRPTNRVICFIFNILDNGATHEPYVTCTVLNSPFLMTPELFTTLLIAERS